MTEEYDNMTHEFYEVTHIISGGVHHTLKQSMRNTGTAWIRFDLQAFPKSNSHERVKLFVTDEMRNRVQELFDAQDADGLRDCVAAYWMTLAVPDGEKWYTLRDFAAAVSGDYRFKLAYEDLDETGRSSWVEMAENRGHMATALDMIGDFEEHYFDQPDDVR